MFISIIISIYIYIYICAYIYYSSVVFNCHLTPHVSAGTLASSEVITGVQSVAAGAEHTVFHMTDTSDPPNKCDIILYFCIV